MMIENTSLEGVKIINPDIYNDDRGYFFESFNTDYFIKKELPYQFFQDNEVKSLKGVIRGLHYQLKKPQGKLVRSVLGSIIDVAVDIRTGSPTFGRSEMVELSSENKKMLYIPEGFAHGYLVTSNESVVLYKCTNTYDPNDEYGIKWDDKTIKIHWNYNSPIISEKDSRLPTLNEQQFLPKY
tara:strand:- start:744 stop:1289 length:546 start_codon:yes stop_codon:yes gene_type:complete